MITRSHTLKLDLTGTQFQDYNKSRLLFFDIETTGLSARTGYIYLIGAIFWYDNTWMCRQWLAENLEDESDVIKSFLGYAKNRTMLVHFNGESFDIPFINEKCRHYHIQSSLSFLNSRDLYRMIRPLKSMLGLSSLKQKSLEAYLGIERKDIYDGGQLIPVFEKFTQTQDAQAREAVFLHNLEDLIGLASIIPLLSYTSITSNNFMITNYEIEEDRLNVLCRLPFQLPKQIRYDAGLYIMYGEAEYILFSIEGKREPLKYFYRDYKNYYYLPEEDTAIHKSVAQYVDKAYREPAKAHNCYQRKNGFYLPQNDEVFTPVFRTEYQGKQLYFPCNDKWMANGENIAMYIQHLLMEK